MNLTKNQELTLRYNWYVRKLNQLESNGKELFEYVPRNYEGITEDDVNFLKNHFEEMDKYYQEFNLGKYEEVYHA